MPGSHEGILERGPSFEDLFAVTELEPLFDAFFPNTLKAFCVKMPSGKEFVRGGDAQQLMHGVRANGEVTEQWFPVMAAAERIGWLGLSSVDGQQHNLTGIARLFRSLVQQAYARWVTGEIHREAMSRSHVELEQQHAELRRALNNLRQADRLKSEFLATVSHELRTPLTSVIGSSELLLAEVHGPLNPEQQECVRILLDRGNDLLRLISAMLDLYRLEEGELPAAERGVHPVTPMLQEAMRVMEWNALQCNIDLRLDADLEFDLEAYAEPGWVQQILVNLIGNAIKFSPDGTVVSIGAHRAPLRRASGETYFGEESPDAVCITVSDEGPGISPDELQNIFEAFYQVDRSPTRTHGGAGLGLSIVKRLVEILGGEVWAERGAVKGSRFCFTLPMTAQDPERTQPGF